MLLNCLSFLHNATTLLFGVYISAAFLGVKMKRKNVLTLLVFSLSVGVVYVLSYIFFGEHVTKEIYPLIVHLPLTLFLAVYYKFNAALSALSVLIAYLCCQISNWMGLAAKDFTGSEIVYYSTRIVTTVAVFIVLIKFVSTATSQLLQKNTQSILILGFLPFVYYLYDYIAGVYTGLLYSGLAVVTEFMGFVLCISYIIFLFIYFKQYEAGKEVEQRNQLLKMQYAQSKKEIEAIRRSKRDVSILRHDMRHFLLNIAAFIENDEKDKALSYINEIIDATDKTAMQQYCQNEIVNMILSLHENQIRTHKIDFRYTIRIPEKLPFSDVDISAILSNSLENAIQAVSVLPEADRMIILNMYMNDTKLLISVKNNFSGAVTFRDGLPLSKEVGHGFGTQSIRYITEKLKGNCQFSIIDNQFTLQVIL